MVKYKMIQLPTKGMNQMFFAILMKFDFKKSAVTLLLVLMGMLYLLGSRTSAGESRSFMMFLCGLGALVLVIVLITLHDYYLRLDSYYFRLSKLEVDVIYAGEFMGMDIWVYASVVYIRILAKPKNGCGPNLVYKMSLKPGGSSRVVDVGFNNDPLLVTGRKWSTIDAKRVKLSPAKVFDFVCQVLDQAELKAANLAK